jgi:hypothetical protein
MQPVASPSRFKRHQPGKPHGKHGGKPVLTNTKPDRAA